MGLIRFLLCLSLSLLAYCTIAVGVMLGPLSLFGLVGLLRLRRKRPSGWAYGTARWADVEDMRRAGMLDADEGIILGHVETPRPSLAVAVQGLVDSRLSNVEAVDRFRSALSRRQRRGLLRLSNAVMTSIFAPTNAGKSSGLIIPDLLTRRDEGIVVVDTKDGELARATAAIRERAFGDRIVLLDPYRKVTDQPDTFNPLDTIDGPHSPTTLDDCRTLAEAMVIKNPHAKEPHWDESAEIWICAITSLVVAMADRRDRSLQTVRAIIADPRKSEDAIKLMQSSDAYEGLLARFGHSLSRYVDRELGSVLTTATRHMRFLDTPAIAESTRRSSFDPAQLNVGGMTVYLILPSEHMRVSAGLLRMWVSSMMRAVVRGGLRG